MVILQKSPDLPQRRQILDLLVRQLAEDDARAGVELMVEIERRLGPHRLRRVPNGFAVDQQMQIVGPHFAGTGDQNAEEELPRIAMHRQRNRVFRPVVCALDLALLHVVEGEVRRVAVLAHPQPHELAHVLAAQESAPLDRRAGEVHGDDLGDGGKACWGWPRRARAAPTIVRRGRCRPSTKMVAAGPPPQPRGDVPLCSVSKLSIASSSGPGVAFWPELGGDRAAHVKINRRRRIAAL